MLLASYLFDDIAVDDKLSISTFLQQTVKEFIWEVVLSEVSKLNDLVIGR